MRSQNASSRGANGKTRSDILDKIAQAARALQATFQETMLPRTRQGPPENDRIVEWGHTFEKQIETLLGTGESSQIITAAQILAETFPPLAYLLLCYNLSSRNEYTVKDFGEDKFARKFIPNLPALPPESATHRDLVTLFGLVREYFARFPPSSLPVNPADFFGDFLARLDKQGKTQHGLIFTPPPVVDFMLGGIDHLLSGQFNLPSGIVDQGVVSIDPAAGLMNFHLRLLRLVLLATAQKPPHEATRDVVQDLLTRMLAVELMPAQVLLGQACVGLELHHLTNIPFEMLPQVPLRWGDMLEKPPADLLKSFNGRVPVVMGNPPYNISSKHKSPWIQGLMEDYKRGLQRAGTKRVSVSRLQDDYAKFYRVAQWIVEQAGQGIVAFISSRSFLDGLVHRGMRAALLEAFDAIYVVDLNGDSRDYLAGHSPGAPKITDENVFEIQQGVAITFLVKLPLGVKGFKGAVAADQACDVYYVGYTGTRESKFSALGVGFAQLPFQRVVSAQDLAFTPQESLECTDYAQFPYLLEIFADHVQGIVSAHDSLVFDADLGRLQNKVTAFLQGEDFRQWGAAARDGRDWNVADARQETTAAQALTHIVPCAYRGFDRRWLCYDLALINKGTNRFPLMQFLVPPGNVAIVTNRLSVTPMDVLVSDCVVDNGMVSGARASRSYVFPLQVGGEKHRHWNIRREFLARLPFAATPEAVFYYIYGLLNAPRYAETYARWLLRDFPRVPFPRSSALFERMAALGRELAGIHLLKAPLPNPSQWPINSAATDRRVQRVTYDPTAARVYFDKLKTGVAASDRYPFWVGEVTPSMWALNIGGIPPLQHWLHARKWSPEHKLHSLPRGLKDEEVETFLRVCDAVRHTLALRPRLDEVYTKIEADLFAFSAVPVEKT